MDKEKIVAAMEHIDANLVAEAAEHKSAARKGGWRRAALIAACLCLVLAGTVVAAESGIFFRILTGSEFFGENFEPEKWPVLEKFPIVGGALVNSSVRVPVSELSKEVREFAVQQEDEIGYYPFNTWAEAEEFLGLEILNNPRLDATQKMHHAVVCGNKRVEGFVILGIPSDMKSVRIVSAYELYSTGISVVASVVTDRADEDVNPTNVYTSGVLGRSYTQEQIDQMEVEEYTMPNGCTATIVMTPQITNSEYKDYSAYFQGDNAIILVSARDVGYHYEPQSEETIDAVNKGILRDLKEVLDAFE